MTDGDGDVSHVCVVLTTQTHANSHLPISIRCLQLVSTRVEEPCYQVTVVHLGGLKKLIVYRVEVRVSEIDGVGGTCDS